MATLIIDIPLATVTVAIMTSERCHTVMVNVVQLDNLWKMFLKAGYIPHIQG